MNVLKGTEVKSSQNSVDLSDPPSGRYILRHLYLISPPLVETHLLGLNFGHQPLITLREATPPIMEGGTSQNFARLVTL